MRGLAVAHQPRHVGHGQWLVGQQLGGVAEPHRAQVGGEGRQADLVIRALELARRHGQGMSDRWQGERAAVVAVDDRAGLEVQLGQRLRGCLSVVRPCSRVR
jgi:hypothetical protein